MVCAQKRVEVLNSQQGRALHPTPYSPFVPRYTPAAGELGRSEGRQLDEIHGNKRPSSTGLVDRVVLT
jgi:hypothetical protein